MNIKAVLINYWPMNNQTNMSLTYASDVKQAAPAQYEYVKDRFLTNIAAVSISTGYFKAPENVYFSGDFSITAWIKLESADSSSSPSSLLSWSFTLLDFGSSSNSIKNNNVIFQAENGILSATIYQNLSLSSKVASASKVISLGVWYHIAFTFGGSNAYLYVNGDQIGNNSNMIAPLNVNRTANSIGKFSGKIKIHLDDLKIFSGSLNKDEVYQDYYPGIKN